MSKHQSQKQAFLDAIDEFHNVNRNQWKWVPSPFFLKTFPEDNVISYLNLSPLDKPSPKLASMEIIMEKTLNFHPSLGWNWHKSWILPEITVKLSQPQVDSKVFAKIFVVKAGLEYSENFFLVDIGVKGSNKQYFIGNQVIFRNLKFSSTSYNNEGLKFHLVVVAVEDLEEESKSNKFSSGYKIIDSKLSPPIYVDSRKSAREINFKENSFLDMFSPELLMKPLFKKRRKNIDKKEELIGNSLKGFIDYYTAPNIRNKIKHPYFIALKFSNCISLYYNESCFSAEKPSDLYKDILVFLKQYNENLSKIYAKKKKTKLFLNKTTDNAYLAIAIRNPGNQPFSKKVSEFLGSFDKRIIKIVLSEEELSERYILIDDLTMLRKVYHEEYERINFDPRDRLTSPHYFLEGRGCFPEADKMPFKMKKIKTDCDENSEKKSESNAFIPEITTMIEINECLPLSKKEKNKIRTMNPEELFNKRKASSKKDESFRSDKLGSDTRSFAEIKQEVAAETKEADIKTEYIVKTEILENKPGNLIKSSQNDQVNFKDLPNENKCMQTHTGLIFGNSDINSRNDFFNPYYGFGPQPGLMERSNPGIYDNFNYLNNLMAVNMLRGNGHYDEYRNFMDKMNMLVSNKQKLDFMMMNSMLRK